ncbi:hypothetical protein [Bifidobacterium eulemuris]|uniref:Uncharacterized protein n=1 Tax=Bifidobacterium eulemuris TaxID=1765219 RepID=A0A261G9X8_9BIFI|nr:hypothetical protein [Bifidobacterium eulemuris]OZG68241.1 hypothetical protein BEUL_1254 [Bifidobacterium eulemuris]QOL31703.1 hypothetical protein BE0216_03920 [Bifidobacterium eulemuris]
MRGPLPSRDDIESDAYKPLGHVNDLIEEVMELYPNTMRLLAHDDGPYLPEPHGPNPHVIHGFKYSANCEVTYQRWHAIRMKGTINEGDEIIYRIDYPDVNRLDPRDLEWRRGILHASYEYSCDCCDDDVLFTGWWLESHAPHYSQYIQDAILPNNRIRPLDGPLRVAAIIHPPETGWCCTPDGPRETVGFEITEVNHELIRELYGKDNDR